MIRDHVVHVALLFALTTTLPDRATAQIPKSGTYTYDIAFAEWGGKSMGSTCTILIQGDSIKVIHNGSGNLAGKKGDILAKGVIRKHKKTGKYIISTSKDDENAEEVNGCEGPSIVDFKRKKFWTC